MSRFPDRSAHAPGLREASHATFYDVDHDGNLDYAIGHTLDEKIRIFWGDGTGELKEDFTDIVAMRAHRFAFGDINADGFIDLVATDPGSGQIGLAFGEGPRMFGEFETSAEDMGVLQVAFGDWNRDGNEQVIFNSNRRDHEVLSRSFDEEMGLAPFNVIYKGIHSMDVGDIDGDGHVELVGLDEDNHLLILTREEGRVVETVVPRPHAASHGEITRTTILNVVQGVGVFIDSSLTLSRYGELYKIHNGVVDVCRVNFPPHARTHAVEDVNNDGILDLGQVTTGGFSTSQYKIFLGQ
jgi:hypothetical protein